MPPQFPIGRMGPQMMRPPFGGGRGPMMGLNRTPPFPMMGRPQQMNGRGGLLSRLLGRGSPMGGGAGGMNGFMGMPQAGRAAGSGSFMQSLTNPGGLTSFLNNTQQVLRTAQQIGPMIQQFQQYGSLMRNLPAMWKIFRSLKDAPAEETNSTAESGAKEIHSESSGNKNKHESGEQQNNSSGSKKKKKTAGSKKQKNVSGSDNIKKEKGASVPKMYI